MKTKQSLFCVFSAVIVALALGVNACKHEPDDNPPPAPKCKCEAGTEHLPGDNGCESMTNGCDCIVVPGTTANGIPITKRENVGNFNDVVTAINGAFNGWEPSQIDVLRNMITEIRVISGSEMPDSTSNNGKYIITVQAERSLSSISSNVGNLFALIFQNAFVQQSARDTWLASKAELDSKEVAHGGSYQKS